jgi:hypothetical protein
MNPAPMRPAQNALVILASFLVAGSLLPWSPRIRLACAAGAIGMVLMLLIVRLRAHANPMLPRSGSRTQARIDRIRAERAARMGRRREGR